MTYIFDNYYYVKKGDFLNFNKKYGCVGERFLFMSEDGRSILGIIDEARENFCSLSIVYVGGE